MIVGAVIGAFGLAFVGVLGAVQRNGQLTRAAGVLLGVPAGAIAGAGVLLGALHQPTTANIHSGYSFAGVFEWLVLAAGGGLLGGGVGGAIGWRLRTWSAGLVVLLVVALGGAAGWVVSTSRATIDCDERPAFCSDRYD